MDFAAQGSLIVALSDLKVVRLIRDAMRTADLQAGGIPGPLGTIINPKPEGSEQDRRSTVLVPTLRIEPRPVLHPTPRIEPRKVYHPTPRIEPKCPPPCEPVQPEKGCHIPCPIQPPWKVRPWEIPIPPQPHVKLIVHRTDVINKGSLIDMFI